MKHFYSTINTLLWLIWREMSVLWKHAFDNIIDSIFMPCSFIVIGGYILPSMGMPANYGSFMVVGSLMLMCYGTASWFGGAPLVNDLSGDQAISYDLTLPIPSWFVMIKTGLGFAINAAVLNILTIPVGKVLLWNSFDLSNFSFFKFFVSYITANILFGFFALSVACWVKDDMAFGRFWMRIGSQLMFFSGFQFSWFILRTAVPWIAYIDLLNPLIYAFEGTRAAVLGQEGSLPFWTCILMMWVWIVLFVLFANYLFKKRLDAV